MRLESVKLKNFRGYRTETIITISDLTALIGKNDAGKSSVLEALEIFFNNKVINCEKEDLNISAENDKIEITCIFSDLPNQLVIDSTNFTSLEDEYLLNIDGYLEIKKIFKATTAKPKEKVYIICNHPSVDKGNDLLKLKRTELRQRAKSLNIADREYNGNLNSSIRQAIWSSFDDLQINITDLLVDKEDSKNIYEAIETHLPIYALFQSDRQSKDDDKEVTDPMKIAIQQALQELDEQIDYINPAKKYSKQIK